LVLSTAQLSVGAPLYMIGHSARDTKRMGGCRVVTDLYKYKTGKWTFGCDCTAFGGNSGSPVFDSQTNRVVGIFWGGQASTLIVTQATSQLHEFVSPIWKLEADKANLDAGTWPATVSFVAAWLRGLGLFIR